jgi:chemotaxis response regulator CheB
MLTDKPKTKSKTAKSVDNRAGERPKARRSPKAPTTLKSFEPTADNLIVVGIGASAGGLDAFKHMLPGLPTAANMAYVIVQRTRQPGTPPGRCDLTKGVLS